MKTIKNKSFDEERALYGSDHLRVIDCSFDGPADGESAFKESSGIIAENCFFNLRYPFWHVDDLKIKGGKMTELCRAALWYCSDIEIENLKMLGIKALRECRLIKIKDSEIDSPEFGWSCDDVKIEKSTATSEYFMLRSQNIDFNYVTLNGKYSFQYVNNATFENCNFETKDAFWHGKNIAVKNSVIKGEYLAWYSDSLTFENCKIIGTQPFCYCKNLKLINCEMIDCDLAFEKSFVEAQIITPIKSVKNVTGGTIIAPSIEEIICDDKNASARIIIG